MSVRAGRVRAATASTWPSASSHRGGPRSPRPAPAARLSAAAAIGGALSWSLVMFISYSGGRLQQNRLILAGIAVSAFCVALGRAALLLDEMQASSVMR